MSEVLETAIEVFGTKEVSVKEFMGSSDKSLVLLSDYEKAKQNLEELKEKHQVRVEELVIVDKLSSDELKELNGIRAELREPRYLIQNIEKNNISVFEAYKKTDKANLKGLIEINNALEDKATVKLQAEDNRKKEEKAAEAKAEELRIEQIKKDIENIETYCYQVIQKMTFENLKTLTESVESSLNGDYDFQEYDLMLDQVKNRIAKQLLEKTNDITERENQRVENEAMKQEIFQVRVNRLKEAGFNVYHESLKDEKEAIDAVNEQVLNASASEFEIMLSEVKKSNEEAQQVLRDAELKKQKDEQLDIRKNRLAEIGVMFLKCKITDKFYFSTVDEYIQIAERNIYNCTITEFEEIITNVKNSIQKAKEQKEIAEKLEKELAEKELKAKEEADKKVAAEKKKADAENKARVKRLANDKVIYEQALKDNLGRFPIVFESEQIEIKAFSVEVSNKVADLLNELLTQLNEL